MRKITDLIACIFSCVCLICGNSFAQQPNPDSAKRIPTDESQTILKNMQKKWQSTSITFLLPANKNKALPLLRGAGQNTIGVRVPDELSVLGVDNDETVCQLCDPQLSSLNQDTVEAGYRVARLIDRLLALPPQERMGQVEDIIVRPTFVAARRSTDAFLHNNPYISKIMYYINANLSSHLGVSDIVSQVPMSRRLLESTFRREVGMSVYQYILHARVEKMKDLMVNGYTPLQAANELDIDYKILARSFKKLVGMSPSAFAREQTAMMRLRESPYA